MILGIVLGIAFAWWVYKIVDAAGGSAVWWALGTFIIWPPFCLAAGLRFRATGLIVAGGVGLLWIVLMIVLAFFGAGA